MTKTKKTKSEVTRLLHAWSGGEKKAAEELLPLVYEELRVLARHYMRKERPGHTLETRALVHEAYVRLVDGSQVEWKGRGHFYGIASQTMRRILVDHARHHLYQKRGGGAPKIPLDDAPQLGVERPEELVALDDALHQLAEHDPEKARIVELRFFGGLTQSEIAEVLDVSLSTVERQWRVARAWLHRALAN
jgi:RNA polymerase sigma factor (TIGR02999 family)